LPPLGSAARLGARLWTAGTSSAGLDANTYATPGPKQQGVNSFAGDFVARGLSSNFGSYPERSDVTSFCARSFLQPQLQKAVRIGERKVCAPPWRPACPWTSLPAPFYRT
jgi:hypothetical protein